MAGELREADIKADSNADGAAQLGHLHCCRMISCRQHLSLIELDGLGVDAEQMNLSMHVAQSPVWAEQHTAVENLPIGL